MLPTVFVIHGDSRVVATVMRACDSRSLHARSYRSAEDFLKLDARELCGCLVLDFVLPGMDGFELLDNLASRDIKIPTIIITGHGNVATCARAFKNGVLDFIEIPFDTESLVECIKLAVQSDMVVREEGTLNAKTLACLDSLTDRQREVLSLLVEGHSMKTVATQLGVSQQTIARHRTGILHTFSVTNDIELVRKMIETGYFTKFNAVAESPRGNS